MSHLVSPIKSPGPSPTKNKMNQLYQIAMAPRLLCPKYPTEDAEHLERCFNGIPKADFHCHLNGSISEVLLAHMERLVARESGEDKDTQEASPTTAAQLLFFNSSEKRSQNVLTVEPDSGIDEMTTVGSGLLENEKKRMTPHERMQYCFGVFDNIYKIMTNLSFIRLAVQDMVWHSAAEHMILLEIRTSLRDGLMSSFRTSSDGVEPPVPVSKQAYVEAITETVEHMLQGGVVDLETGELIPLQKDADYEKMSPATRYGDAWWRHFKHLYASLMPQHHQTQLLEEDEKQAMAPRGNNNTNSSSSDGEEVKRTTLRDTFSCELLTRLQQHTSTRMHVRLLLSINRGASVELAEEAVSLAHAVQQAQIYTFYKWCVGTGRQLKNVSASHQRRDSISSVGSRVSSLGGLGNSSVESLRLRHPEMHDRLRRTCWVTGTDLSGNCYKGTFKEFEPALTRARTPTQQPSRSTYGWRSKCPLPLPPSSLAVTLHGAEKKDSPELADMIAFAPDRWGHLVYADTDEFERILNAGGGIELCITSNLLTSGHADVAQHHMDRLMNTWWRIAHPKLADVDKTLTPSLIEHLVGSRYVYHNTQERRLQQRFRRWRPAAAAAAGPAPTEEPSEINTPVYESPPSMTNACPLNEIAIPNISFHTDDRGVFGTSLAHELLLLVQHPSAWKSEVSFTRTEKEFTAGEHYVLAEAMWYLQRLALLQVFEMPWPVALLALFVITEDDTSEMHEDDDDACPALQPTLMRMRTNARWQHSWDDFVSLLWSIHATAPEDLSDDSNELTVQGALSRWEWRWLTACFDHFFV